MIYFLMAEQEYEVLVQIFSQKTFLSVIFIDWLWLSVDTLLVTLDIEHIIFLAVNLSN